MKYKELKSKKEAELKKLLIDSQEKLRELRFKVASDQLKNVRELRDVKKTIAKIMFLLRAKDLKTEQEPDQEIKEGSK